MDKENAIKQLPRMIILVAVFGCIILGGQDYAYSSKKMKGLNFQVPEDWPIEKRAGITAPIPTEEYVSIKFKEIEEEFQKIQSKFSDDFNELRLTIKSTETDFFKKINQISSQGVPSADNSQELSDMKVRLDRIESEVGRLDRKITNKVNEMNVHLGEKDMELKDLKEKVKNLQTIIYKLDEKVDYISEEEKSAY